MRAAIREFARDRRLADPSVADSAPGDEVSLLIGIDQFYKLAFMNQEEHIADGLVAKNSHFGWLVGGAFGVHTIRGDFKRTLPVCCAAILWRPAEDLERLWSLEAFGVKDEQPTHSMSVDEEDALRQFNGSVALVDCSYRVAMPKRKTIAALDNNLETAHRRLMAKRRSLVRNPDIFDRYDSEIMAFVRNGFAKEILDVDVTAPSAQDGSYFMPHQSVITTKEDGQKWRIVFDCSAAAPGGTSLNSHLLPGPNLNPDMVLLLLNFRRHPVAVSADVAKAYMTIQLADEDRLLFQFLWQGPTDTAPRV